ncbi:lipoprotein LpqH [Mycolicibacterium setense]|nr:lipoprotein LpqH [Mycolicibacterium setense]
MATRAVMVLALFASACAAPAGPPADANSARISIDNQELSRAFQVQCTQRSWLWTIETLPEEPGFTAIIQTGATVEPKVMRLRDMTGFTGSTPVEGSDAQASIDGTTFHVSGTAHGSFADRPTKPAEVQYRMEAHC